MFYCYRLCIYWQA